MSPGPAPYMWTRNATMPNHIRGHQPPPSPPPYYPFNARLTVLLPSPCALVAKGLVCLRLVIKMIIVVVMIMAMITIIMTSIIT